MAKAKKELQKTARVSADIPNENLQKLRVVFPQFVKDGAVDFDALQKFFDKEGIEAGQEKYGLSWAGKSDAFKAIRIPATGTLLPQEKESKSWDTTENLFIEGDNLEALKLLQKRYSNPGKIKMIYIDPPYNTGKDFIYKDNFTENVSDYYERTGQSKDGVKLVSNPESNGRYHSDWLTMMYPRLFLARNLLRDDGVIFISIDDNEVANLRLIMDEIFGEEDFIAQFIWNKKNVVQNDADFVSVNHEYVFCYARDVGSLEFNLSPRTEEQLARYKNPDNDPRGPWTSVALQAKSGSNTYEITFDNGVSWKPVDGTYPRLSKESLLRAYKEGRLWFGERGRNVPRLKKYLSEVQDGVISNTLLLSDDVGSTQLAKETLKKLIENNVFETPKPLGLIGRFITLVTSKDEKHIVLDFFAGSATTAHAVMAQNAEDGGNRKWICVQLPEVTNEDSEAYKAGYKTIAEIAKERIRRAGKQLEEERIEEKVPPRRFLQEEMGYKDREVGELESDAIGELDTGFKSFELAKSNYRQWNVLTEKDSVEKLKAQMRLFVDKPLIDGYDERAVVYEVLVKEGFDLNSKATKEKNGALEIWRVVDNERTLAITFAKKITREQVESLKLTPADIFVCFDSALDDSTKLNIMRGVNVRVI